MLSPLPCLSAVVAALSLSGCANPAAMGVMSPGRGNASFLAGPGITPNRTPLDDALSCYGMALRRSGRPTPGIAVGEVRDFTGRVTDTEGAQITQGGGLMVYSALGKLGGAVRVHERLDPRIAEVELIYMDRRQLGDGRRHRAQVGQQRQEVPWIPYFGGSIARSDYFIVGGITELNQVISSGGFELGVSMIGGRARTFTINIAVDLRIVSTSNLVVSRAVTLQKQIVGYEVGIDVFRFFGSRLVDANAGVRSLEPVQLAVRAVLELATMELLDAVSGVDHRPCLPSLLVDRPERSGSDPAGEAETNRRVQQEPLIPANGRLAADPASVAAPTNVPAPSAGHPPASRAQTTAPAGAGAPQVAPQRPVTAPPQPVTRPQRVTPDGRVSPPLTPRPSRGAVEENSGTAMAAATESAPVLPQSRSGSTQGIVLAAMSSEDNARAAWSRARARHTDLLGDKEAHIRQVGASANGQPLWIVALALPGGTNANRLCDALQARGTACVVAPRTLSLSGSPARGGVSAHDAPSNSSNQRRLTTHQS